MAVDEDEERSARGERLSSTRIMLSQHDDFEVLPSSALQVEPLSHRVQVGRISKHTPGSLAVRFVRAVEVKVEDRLAQGHPAPPAAGFSGSGFFPFWDGPCPGPSRLTAFVSDRQSKVALRLSFQRLDRSLPSLPLPVRGPPPDHPFVLSPRITLQLSRRHLPLVNEEEECSGFVRLRALVSGASHHLLSRSQMFGASSQSLVGRALPRPLEHLPEFAVDPRSRCPAENVSPSNWYQDHAPSLLDDSYGCARSPPSSALQVDPTPD
ncbi:hypothetical protein V8D89_004286 [Ganoderma adspersum]